MKLKKPITILLSTVMVLGAAVSVYAAERYDFSVDFTHQVNFRQMLTATQGSADFSFYTTSKSTSDSIIQIDQYREVPVLWYTDMDYVQSTEIGCGVEEWCYASMSTDAGSKYSYIFVKSTDGGSIVGSGYVDY